MHTIRWCISKSTNRRVKMIKAKSGGRKKTCGKNAVLHTRRVK